MLTQCVISLSLEPCDLILKSAFPAFIYYFSNIKPELIEQKSRSKQKSLTTCIQNESNDRKI